MRWLLLLLLLLCFLSLTPRSRAAAPQAPPLSPRPAQAPPLREEPAAADPLAKDAAQPGPCSPLCTCGCQSGQSCRCAETVTVQSPVIRRSVPPAQSCTTH